MAEHKHAAVLRAIADGKVVQWQASDGSWLDATQNGCLNPFNYPSFNWRVKPEPKPDVVRYVPFYETSGWTSLAYIRENYRDATGIAMLTIDGETEKLKSVEIVE